MPQSFPRIALEALLKGGSGPLAAGFTISFGFHPTPLGRVILGETGGKICYMAFAPEGRDEEMLTDLSQRWPGVELTCEPKSIARTAKRIFEESDSSARSIELLVRGTEFQVAVWKALLKIPTGTVCSYAEVAQRVGRPKAVRAVGSAIGANPITWIIPCHRVLRSNGGLGGYRWGLEAKKACLAFEKLD